MLVLFAPESMMTTILLEKEPLTKRQVSFDRDLLELFSSLLQQNLFSREFF
jgi:hypothetical protein